MSCKIVRQPDSLLVVRKVQTTSTFELGSTKPPTSVAAVTLTATARIPFSSFPDSPSMSFEIRSSRVRKLPSPKVRDTRNPSLSSLSVRSLMIFLGTSFLDFSWGSKKSSGFLMKVRAAIFFLATRTVTFSTSSTGLLRSAMSLLVKKAAARPQPMAKTIRIVVLGFMVLPQWGQFGVRRSRFGVLGSGFWVRGSGSGACLSSIPNAELRTPNSELPCLLFRPAGTGNFKLCRM